MITYIFLAILNGIVIGTSRAMNSRLSFNVGAFRASFWNHIVGFLFLLFALTIVMGWHASYFHQIPVYTYLGGLFGALFVALNSYVFQRIGAIKTIMLVIGGQMILGVLIDHSSGNMKSTLMQVLGVIIILLGVYLAKTISHNQAIHTTEEFQDER